jgi:hypothetical protein
VRLGSPLPKRNVCGREEWESCRFFASGSLKVVLHGAGLGMVGAQHPLGVGQGGLVQLDGLAWPGLAWPGRPANRRTEGVRAAGALIPLKGRFGNNPTEVDDRGHRSGSAPIIGTGHGTVSISIQHDGSASVRGPGHEASTS